MCKSRDWRSQIYQSTIQKNDRKEDKGIERKRESTKTKSRHSIAKFKKNLILF